MNWAWLGAAFSVLKNLPWISKAATVLGSVGPAFGFLTPIIAAVVAVLEPIFIGLSRFVVAAAESIGSGLRISITNVAAFWAIYPAVFMAGFYLAGAIDPFGAMATKRELKEVVRENDDFRRQLGKPARDKRGTPAISKNKKDTAKLNDVFTRHLGGGF